MRIRLVQRATVPSPSTWKKDGTFITTLDTDYMGSAEYEFGAVPMALARFIGSTDKKVMGMMDVTSQINGEVFTVRYLVRASQEKELVDAIKNWEKVSRNFKERAPLVKEKAYLSDPPEQLFYLGIDMDSEFFLWRSKFGKRLIRNTLVETLKALKGNPRYRDFVQDVEISDDIYKVYCISTKETSS